MAQMDWLVLQRLRPPHAWASHLRSDLVCEIERRHDRALRGVGVARALRVMGVAAMRWRAQRPLRALARERLIKSLEEENSSLDAELEETIAIVDEQAARAKSKQEQVGGAGACPLICTL